MRVHRLEVGLQDNIDDPRGEAARSRAVDYLALPVTGVRTRSVYKIAIALADDDVARVRAALTDPVIEQSAVGRLPLPPCDWVICIGFRPGVTDNVGRTARVFVTDLLGKRADELPRQAQVFTETLYFVTGPALTEVQVRRLATELLANELIERVELWPADRYASSPIDLALPRAGSEALPRTEAVALPDDDDGLLALSRERMLSLSRAEMMVIRDHYRSQGVAQHRERVGLPPAPTDVELEALAQTWSEHCKHKIFAADIRYTDEHGQQETIRSLFKTFIVGPTERVGRQVDWLVSVFHDNAGVVRLDADTHLVYKVETHNSPSALDPYGGAMTGIVGVNRDPFGTGLGAALLTNVWGYCFGPPDHQAPLPQGLLHPRRIRDNVHRGVIDGGNQSGIPYSRGWELFDERYLGKPLVFCGTVGVMPSEVVGGPSERKEIEPGDLVVMVGGRIGKDGIHGATFSSEALHGASPAQAVQIGDPITQKMMTDMLLEARDLGLYRAITDNGAGGLSSSVGELAQLSGGAELELADAPLKYEGLMPWEILLSEAQERMTLAVPPDRLEALLALARRREVEATAIGRFTDSGRFIARYRGELVADLEMSFLHDGCPTLELDAIWQPPQHAEPEAIGIDLEAEAPDELLLDLLGSFNLGARDQTSRQYDHEVKGLSVVKPLCGVARDVPSDATVMRVQHGRNAAVLLAEGIAPRVSDIDGGAMGAYVVDLAVRRIIAGGGELGRIAALDNFCWPDPVQSELTPDGHQKLATLVRCCRALAEMTEGLELPLISGKDSMKNDSTKGGVKISIPPTLLLSAIGWIDDARRAIDLRIPAAEHRIYVLGETGPQLGASELYALLGARRGRPLIGNQAPRTTPAACRAVCEAVQQNIHGGHVNAAHALHAGGLAMGLATLGLASGLGIDVALDALPRSAELAASPVRTLFSESASRFLVAVPHGEREAFEHRLRPLDLAWAEIGRTTERPTLRISDGGRELLALEVDAMRARYHHRGL